MLTSSRTTNILLIIVIAIGIGIVAVLATGVRGGPLDPPAPPSSTDGVRQPGTPIHSLPYQIAASGRYYLTRDLSYNGTGDAISIAPFVEYVTVDLGGFTLGGYNQGTGIRGLGPTPPSQFPLMIKNGYIAGFQTGINVEMAAHTRIDNVHVYASQGSGFVLGNHNVVSNCTAANNGVHGILINGALTAIHDCMIVDNTQSGVHVNGPINLIEGSQVFRNGNGIHFSVLGNESVVRGNDVYYEQGKSILLDSGTTENDIYENALCTTLNNGQADNVFVSNFIHC